MCRTLLSICTMTSKNPSLHNSHRLQSKSLFTKQQQNSCRSSPLKPESTKESSEYVLPSYILHEAEHYRQRFNWDCGVSCVLMVLSPDNRTHFLENFTSICQEEGFGESTWTIDLCYLLKRFNLKHDMYSTNLGVNEDLIKLNYYDHRIKLDRQRVQQRFEEAAANGLDVRKRELSNYKIKRHLAECGPIIALIDNGMVVCDLCKHNKLKYEFRKVLGGSYCGHYVLLVGYSRNKILYRDPSLSRRVCATSFARLTEARTASGTDQDLVLVYNKYS